MYREGATTDQMCQKWFAKIHSGDFSLDNAPWSGRTVAGDSNQTETLIENNQCYTIWEIVILKIFKSIKLLVKIKNVSLILWKKHVDFLANPTLGTYSGIFKTILSYVISPHSILFGFTAVGATPELQMLSV